MDENSTKWACFALACMVSGLDFGMVFSFGALFVEILDTFGTDRASAATVHSLLLGITLSFGVISGILINILGLPIVVLLSSILLPLGFCVSFFITDIYYLYITIGILSGIGISMGHISAVTSISRVFTGKQTSMCVTVLTTCGTVAGIVYPYALKWLVSTYGLRGTFLILGGVYINNFAFFVLTWMERSRLAIKMQRDAVVENITRDNSCSHNSFACSCRHLSDAVEYSKKLLSKPYTCLVVAAALAMSSVNSYLELAFDIADDKGFNEAEAKELFLMLNCFNVVATIAPGFVKQIKCINIYVCPVASSCFGSFGHILLYFSSSYAINAIGACCIGMVPGGIIASSVIIIMETMNLNQVGVATGLISTINGLLSAGGGPLFGSIRDKSGSYATVLISIASIQAAAAILFILALLFERQRTSRLCMHESV